MLNIKTRLTATIILAAILVPGFGPGFENDAVASPHGRGGVRRGPPARDARPSHDARPTRPAGGRPRAVPVYRGPRHGRDARVVVVPPRHGDAADAFAAEMFLRHVADLDCGRMGELLRRVSNEILEATQITMDRPGRARSLREMLRRPAFARAVMARLTDAFAGCDRPCFDDGVAVGIISGSGYCNAALGVDGLPDDGFRFQERLPLCETANFVGCQQGYTQAVNSVQGCLAYATGRYSEAFKHSVSQDCHIDAP